MADVATIGGQFVDFYYAQFDRDRSGLQPLYRDHSMLSWEGTPFQGVNNIIEKLVNLPFQKVQHKVLTRDVQPSNPAVPSLLVAVTGLLLVDDGTNPLQFSQTFQLIPEGDSYFVLNDMFRLNYGS